MSELYWLGRIGNIHECASIFSYLLFFAFAALLIAAMVYQDGDEAETAKLLVCWAKRSVIAAFSCLLVAGFVPSTREMLIIYGAGNVIDYAKSNAAVKELPDNAVKALNKWLEKELEDEKETR